MRNLLLFSALAFLAGCSSGRIRPEDLAYARKAQYQSLVAFQMCSAENTDNPQRCDALIRLQDADQKRLEGLTTAQ